VSVVRPRQLVHRGVVAARGVVLDVAMLGEEAARGRALALWRPGAQVRRSGELRVVTWDEPRSMDCAAAPGAPLVAVGRLLASAPLADAERPVIDKDEQDAVGVVRGGALEVSPLDRWAREDPAAWIDLGEWTAPQVETLGAPPPDPLPIPMVTGDARAVLKDVPPAAAARDELLGLLQSDEGAAGGRSLARSRLGALAMTLLAWLAASGGDASPRRRLESREPTVPAGPSPLDRARAWLQHLAARLLVALRLAQYMGRRHAEYLQRMLDYFERGDLDQALRHAIPIDGQLEGEAPPPALLPPSPRADLTIHPHATRARSALGVSDDIQSLLRETYRRAHERLAREGRIEQAAFVLAELLHANEEAVSFLEAHGRARVAAELAEARGLPPGLVVRQWFLAGETARAIAVARRTGAFADAVGRLERASSPHAATLRVLWAEALAAAGAYAAAVSAVWPVEGARGIAKAWIARGIEAGGPDGAILLVRRATLEPDAAPAVRSAALALLGDADPMAWATRAALAQALVDEKPRVPLHAVLARAAARSLLGAPLPGAQATRRLLDALVRAADDGPLAADLPALAAVEAPSLARRAEPLRVVLARRAPGAVAALDAAALPDGRTLVALGEAGARLLSREGKTVASFDQPAHALVVSHAGDRAIALAPRGRAVRLARIDVAGRRAQAWCDARVRAWADDFDGAAWVVTDDASVSLIDTTTDGWSALQRIDGLYDEDPPTSVRKSGAVAWVLTGGFGFGVQRFDLPGLVLRASRAISLPEGIAAEAAAGSQGRAAFVVLLLAPGAPPRAELQVIDGDAVLLRRPWPIGDTDRKGWGRRLAHSEQWLAAVDGGDVVLFDALELRERLRLVLEGASRTCIRLDAERLCVADDVGRVVTVDLASGAVRHLDLRP
jgi:hypothetical protein